MSDTIEQYRSQIAARLGKIDLRAIPGLRASAAAIELGLAAATVLPRLDDARAGGDPLALGDVLARSRRAVIQGDPGAGKTTLLSCLCLAFSDVKSGLRERIVEGRNGQDPALPDGLVPVLLRLAHFRPRRESAHELSTWMAKILTEDHGEAQAQAVMAEVDAGRGLVCLDGLDEIGDEGTRLRVAQVLEVWAEGRDGVCWVTTRSHGALALKGFEAYAVRPFGRGEMREYLIRRERARGREPAAAARSADAWLGRFAARPEALAVLRHPLLLVIALASEEMGRRLPTERVYLYENVIETLVTAWNRARRPDDALRRSTGAGIDARAVLRALAAACLDFHTDGTLGQSLHRGEWTRALARHLGRGVSGEEYAEEALAVLVEQAGLLVREGAEGLRLWHVSLGEYLAATALARSARDRPQRLLRPIGSSQGQEVMRMAIAWTRSIAGDPLRASRMVASLLERDGCGPWARLLGTSVAIAVDCIIDVHPLDDAGFSRVLPKVLDLFERAPLRINAEPLEALARAFPRFAPTSAEVRRIVGVLRAEARLLPSHVAVSMTRWVARAAPRCAEALAHCEAALAGDGEEEKRWAALGLLRAGRVREDACRIAADWCERGANGHEVAREPELLAEIDDRPTRAAALRALLALAPFEEAVPERPARRRDWTDPQRTRYAAAVLLAALGEDRSAELAALAEGGLADRPYKEASRSAFAWLARTSDAARRWLGDALIGEHEAYREIAVAVLKRMLRTPGSEESAADALFLALGCAGDRLPNAVAFLTHDPNRRLFDNTRTLQDVLRSFAGSAVEGLAILAGRCRGESGFRERWTLAVALWDDWSHREGTAPADLAACLIEGLNCEEVAVRVMSACRLARVWERCSEPLRRSIVRAWVGGLASAGAPVEATGHFEELRWRSLRDPPVDAIAWASWQALAHRLPEIDEDGRAELRAALASERGLQGLIAACVLLAEPATAARCEAMLLQALQSDDLQRVCVAFRALGSRVTSHHDAMVAGIRLALTGWLPPLFGHQPATREILELFLGAPWTIGCNVWDWKREARNLLDWLAQHPDARALAFARLDSGEPSQGERASLLLAACLTTPGQIADTVAEALRAGPKVRAGSWKAVREVLSRDSSADEREPLRAAARRGLGELLRVRLGSDELDEVHAAVRQSWAYGIGGDGLPVAHGRLLQAPDLAWRVELIDDWMKIRCPPERREAFAHEWFGVGIEALADALRPCVACDDAKEALHAGLLLARLCGEVEPLRAVARRILAEPATDAWAAVDEEWQSGFFYLLATDAARQLAKALLFDKRCSGVRRGATLALVELADEGAWTAIRGLLVGADGLLEGVYWSSIGEWLTQHRPGCWAALEPEGVRELGRCRSDQVPVFTDWLRRMSGLSPFLLAALANRWAEWLHSEARGEQVDFAAYIGGAEPLPEVVVARWWRELDGTDVLARERAALALALAGECGAAVVDGLIEVFLRETTLAAARAWERLIRPEYAEAFGRRRRLRAQRWQSPEEAHALAALWSTVEEAGADSDVTMPLLLAAVECADEEVARRSACDLLALDRPAGLAALRRLSRTSTRAAALLFDQADVSAEDRLWCALEHVEDDEGWQGAAAVLFRCRRDDPRLAAALARTVGVSRRRAGEALWLLNEISRPAALRATLDRLAWTGASYSTEIEFLSSLCNDVRPGAPPSMYVGGWWSSFHISPGVAEVESIQRYESGHNEHVHAALQYSPTLEGVAAGLIELARAVRRSLAGYIPAQLNESLHRLKHVTEVEIPAAMASLLGEETSRCAALWTLAQGGHCSESEIAAIGAIVDLRPDDPPGRRLARLWWRKQLLADALLEREALALADELPAGEHASEAAHLAALLASAFSDESALRGFLGELGVADEVVGAPVPLTHLRTDAALVLIRCGRQKEAVRRAVDCGALSERLASAWTERWSPKPRDIDVR